MMNIPAMLGIGGCDNCNKLAEEVNTLRLQCEVDHACFRQREELMQAEIDSLRNEKQNGVYRSGGFNTGNVGE